MRKWVEIQFKEGVGWGDFAKKWQFGHVLAIKYFDLFDDSDLKLCWNFVNIKVLDTANKDEIKKHVEVSEARKYFEGLYSTTSYLPCKNLVNKIDNIGGVQILQFEKEEKFMLKNIEYLTLINTYSEFEFELLNRGRNPAQVKEDVSFMKKFDGSF